MRLSITGSVLSEKPGPEAGKENYLVKNADKP
jgi:hypothetical protein